MRSGNLRSFVVAALAAVATVWATGCAQGVGTVDRTQAHRIDKSWLNDGKPWYFLQTVVDAPPTTNFTFVGESSFPPDRIVWSVQENWLYAYRNYEWIKGSQQPYSSLDHGTAGGSRYFGAPIAAYTVTSHFDIQRDYNAQTGEQTNVIEENTTDRPWYQRQYMHVDWSNNGLSSFNFLNLGIGNSGTTLLTTPVAYYPDEEDPTNKDRAEITPNYIGIVNKLTYQAELDQEATQELGFPIYKCLLFTNSFIGDCGPGEVKVRLSFKKIEDDHDFFPRNYTDKDVNMFGVWQMNRAVYDPERGYITADFSANSMAVMHHIWQKDHAAIDPNTKIACDIHDSSNPACEMPLNQRNPKPLMYYVSEDWPALGDPNHKTMWLQAKLLAEDYNDDMRSVVAAARRGGVPVPADPALSPVDSTGAPVANFQFVPPEVWAEQNHVTLTNTKNIKYNPDGTIDYRGASGLDYLTYPRDTRQMAFSEGGYDVMGRPNVTLVDSQGNPCTADQVAAGTCTVCDPTQHYCQGIGHLPYTVVPRMFTMCHNPVQPRVVHKNDVLPDGTTYAGDTIDKSDPTKPESYDFSTPGDPTICDARSDGDRKTAPLNPQMGDLRYHMLAWVPQPDINSPGGIGEPAMDPVTGEIVSAHAYIYARAIESQATYGADLVAILNGWENVSDLIQGNLVKDYVITTQNRIPPIFSAERMTNYVTSATIQNKIKNFQYQHDNHALDLGGVNDTAVTNWRKLSAINDPRLPTGPVDEYLHAFAPDFGLSGQGSVPGAIREQFTYAQLAAPDSVTTFNSTENLRAQVFKDHHIMDQAEIEPAAVRLAQYYKNQLSPGAVTNPCAGDPNSPVYRTCVWEAARQEILGNLWRSVSEHEVGHTFGQYHNFAGSTDALNYFDPYWDIRKENTISVSSTAPAGSPGLYMFQHLGTVPSTALPGGKTDTAMLAPEFMQAPTQQSLLEGLREYQYTSIMDYNSKFNSDFQGIGKYDHACHMYQYARQVEVFDPDQLPKVPANTDIDDTTTGTGQPTHQHQVADELLIPFNRHYTLYPWLINDGLGSEAPNAKTTPLAQGISKMIHARKWVSYNDLMNGISSADQAKVNGYDDVSKFNASLMVPYRFCSDNYNRGQAHCLWFDEGADPYEQATSFIAQYKLNYFFNSFKRGSATFAPYESEYSYITRLWQRNFEPLVRIFQHAVNDEFIVRFDPKYNCYDKGGQNGITSHVNSIQCGLDRLATQATIMDFYSKILQTPNTGQYGWVNGANTYCSTESGHCNPGNPDPNDLVHPALNIAPGESSRYDESQFDINKFGQLYYWSPTVLGNIYDKMQAIRAMTYYESYIVGAENSKPFNYLISMASWFDQDVVNSIGGLFVDDPAWTPRIAYYATDPANQMGAKDHPPVALYQNTEALRDIAAAQVPNEPWCTAGSGGAPPPGLINCPAFLSFDGQFDRDETKLPSIGYATQPLDPGPVYYERTEAIIRAVIYLTSSVDNLQFLRTIKVNMKGSGTFDNTAVQPLSCGDGSACLQGVEKTCADKTKCAATGICGDFSQCILRGYTCSDGSECAGVCMDPSNPTAETCNPRKYAEFTDIATGNTYFATTYLAQQQAPYGNHVPQAIPYYSIGYQLVNQAASAARLTPNQPLNSVQLMDILRALYYYWSYDPYFRPG